MATFLELKAQAEALAQRVEEARLLELQNIIDSIRTQVIEYGITPEQIFGRRRAASMGTRSPVPPKYQDPKTGATWTGRGKPPQWISGVKNRDRYLIPIAD
ncbi:TPA: H-NS histone family protein [Burkholderia cenocepacia]|nr:H-NS histone family protein [Burkholderia cenocepacia]HDR9888526.1 H-NS histone family protein [Burkholderia cenocepacia]